MALQMVHMEIAYRVIDKLDITEGKEQFILGSVAPDSVHFRDPYLVEEKIHTHLFEGCGTWSDTDDYDRWKSNIAEFRDKFALCEPDPVKRAFLLGICVHCWTDYCNDVLVWRALQKKYIPPMTTQEFRENYYPEARLLDQWLHQNSENTKEIMRLLDQSKPVDFEDYLRAEDIEKTKQHLLHVQYDVPKADISDNKFYPKEMMTELIDAVVTDPML